MESILHARAIDIYTHIRTSHTHTHIFVYKLRISYRRRRLRRHCCSTACVCVFMYKHAYIHLYNLKPMPFVTNSTCIFALYAPILMSCTQGHCAKILERAPATQIYLYVLCRSMYIYIHISHTGYLQLIGSSYNCIYYVL